MSFKQFLWWRPKEGHYRKKNVKVMDGITNIVLQVKPPATGLGLLRALGLRCGWRVHRVIKISMIYLHEGLKIFITLMAVCSLENKDGNRRKQLMGGWEDPGMWRHRRGGEAKKKEMGDAQKKKGLSSDELDRSISFPLHHQKTSSAQGLS